MSGLISKFNIKTASLMLACIFAFACIAACIITAAPSNAENDAVLTAAIGPVRIVAPTDKEEYIEFAPETEAPNTESISEIVTVVTDAIKAAAPETETKPAVTEPVSVETVPETLPAETAPAVTEEVTTAEETTVPVTEPVVTEPVVTEPVVTEPIPEPLTNPLPLPDPNSKLLVDELGLVHTVEKPTFAVTEEEIILAATIIQLEVMGNGSSLYGFEDVQEKYWEMLSVAQCIRNRTVSKLFPSTVKGVILQSHKKANGKLVYQFSPAEDLALYTPTAEAITAAREVLTLGVTVLPSNYYYFCATRITDSFEEWNDYMLVKDADGNYDRVEGHLTTFYAGHK